NRRVNQRTIGSAKRKKKKEAKAVMIKVASAVISAPPKTPAPLSHTAPGAHYADKPPAHPAHSPSTSATAPPASPAAPPQPGRAASQSPPPASIAQSSGLPSPSPD